MNEVFEKKTLRLNAGSKKSYADTFKSCRIILGSVEGPRFFNCFFVDCQFEPPIPMDGNGFGAWHKVFQGCVINSPLAKG